MMKLAREQTGKQRQRARQTLVKTSKQCFGSLGPSGIAEIEPKGKYNSDQQLLLSPIPLKDFEKSIYSKQPRRITSDSNQKKKSQQTSVFMLVKMFMWGTEPSDFAGSSLLHRHVKVFVLSWKEGKQSTGKEERDETLSNMLWHAQELWKHCHVTIHSCLVLSRRDAAKLKKQNKNKKMQGFIQHKQAALSHHFPSESSSHLQLAKYKYEKGRKRLSHVSKSLHQRKCLC